MLRRLFFLAATLLLVASTPRLSGAQAPVHITSWPTTDLPLGLVVGPSGNVYVAKQDGVFGEARVYNPSGVFLGYVGAGAPETYGVAFLHTGQFLVARYYDRTIDRFDAGGTYIGSWFISGSRSLHLAVDEADNVYVTDDEGDRVRKVDTSGNVVASWSTPHPSGIAYLNGKVYVAGMFNNTMSIFLPDGTPAGSFPHGMLRSMQLCVNASGNLILGDFDGLQLKCYKPDGTLVWAMGSTVPGYVAGTWRPTGLAVGPGGTILVGDYDHRRVVVLGEQPTPAAPTTWGVVKDHYRR